MDHEQLLKKFRKKPLAGKNDFPVKLNLNRDDIKKIIPHREPFLLLDSIIGLDPEKEMIMGKRSIPMDDPVFKGHFPGYPVYPGSLQLEMTGQLGLCLHYFLVHKTSRIMEAAAPSPIRATRIIGAYFQEPLLPGDEAVLIAQKLEYDEFFGTIIGQVICRGKVCSLSISEVYFVE
ncbi:MAG: beta-hydroxyacyl-ACP dehydratase [bacterium]|nr:beta-hydroxyacyl-ACP dehydratase [bacterium]